MPTGFVLGQGHRGQLWGGNPFLWEDAVYFLYRNIPFPDPFCLVQGRQDPKTPLGMEGKGRSHTAVLKGGLGGLSVPGVGGALAAFPPNRTPCEHGSQSLVCPPAGDSQGGLHVIGARLSFPAAAGGGDFRHPGCPPPPPTRVWTWLQTRETTAPTAGRTQHPLCSWTSSPTDTSHQGAT